MIPKIIHQIWLGDKKKMPVDFMKTVRDKHSGWKYILWTEENISHIVNHKKFKIVSEYNKSVDNKFTNLANILRYEKLFEYGGIYIDADDEMLELGKKIEYVKTIVNYLERILREINNRNWNIKNTIAWKQFLHGE